MDNTALWNKIRTSAKELASNAAEKTEELTKLGKAKLAVLNVKRSISKKFTELGGITYEAVKNSSPKELAKHEAFTTLIESIRELETDLAAKEEAYDSLKKAAKKTPAGGCCSE